MAEYLENPRRAARIPLRCRARVALASGAVETTTEDVGARGCQIVLPRAVEVGQVLRLALDIAGVPDTLEVEGRVAWVSPLPPWRAGVAILDPHLVNTARWLDGVRAAFPELFSRRRAPPRVAMETLFYLGSAPRFPDFGDGELALLRQVGTGLRVRDVHCSSAEELRALQHRFFALLEQGYLTLSSSAASHPREWRAILGETVGGPALPSSPGTPPDALSPGTSVPSQAPVHPAPASRSEARPAPAAEAEAWPEGSARGHLDSAGRARPHSPDFKGAGIGWRASAGPRPAEADTLYRHALAEIEAGRTNQALALLRRALAIVPGDTEIADAIGRAMRRG